MPSCECSLFQWQVKTWRGHGGMTKMVKVASLGCTVYIKQDKFGGKNGCNIEDKHMVLVDPNDLLRQGFLTYTLNSN